MNPQETGAIAKYHLIKPDGISKIDLIQNTQQQENNFDCFASAANGERDQPACLRRADYFEDAEL